jgi:hypothetical protein
MATGRTDTYRSSYNMREVRAGNKDQLRYGRLRPGYDGEHSRARDGWDTPRAEGWDDPIYPEEPSRVNPAPPIVAVQSPPTLEYA